MPDHHRANDPGRTVASCRDLIIGSMRVNDQLGGRETFWSLEPALAGDQAICACGVERDMCALAAGSRNGWETAAAGAPNPAMA